MKSVGRLISAMTAGSSGLAGILVLVMVCHVAADVVMRYVFETPLNSTILYVSAFYMVAVSFLPLGLVEQHEGHIAVELLTEKFPARAQHWLLILATLLTVIVTATVAVRTGQEALAKYASGTFSIEAGGKVITWPTYFFLPVGFGLMALVSGLKLAALATGRASGLSIMKIEDPYLAEAQSDV